MAFGQQSGPPASAKQVQELMSLLQEAGHVDLRDARGPMGFTQRQAAGKFTRDEATAFIERLQETGSEDDSAAEGAPVVRLSAPLSHTRAAGALSRLAAAASVDSGVRGPSTWDGAPPAAKRKLRRREGQGPLPGSMRYAS